MLSAMEFELAHMKLVILDKRHPLLEKHLISHDVTSQRQFFVSTWLAQPWNNHYRIQKISYHPDIGPVSVSNKKYLYGI